MAALAQLGYQVDVISADTFAPSIGSDSSLLPHVENNFSTILRLNPPTGLATTARRLSKIFSHFPDPMGILHQTAYEHLLDMDLSQYNAVITWSPFHSVNPVMVRVKKQRENVRWIAQFSDPWANNPIERNWLRALWGKWREPATVESADYIVHSSRYSLDLMMKGRSTSISNKTRVIPHAFDEALYPSRLRTDNSPLVIRYVGTFFGKRTPETLFLALSELFSRRSDLKGVFRIELIGNVPGYMLRTPSARALPPGTVINRDSVDYMKSLELMYDADILLLIEADVRQNLFLPSKLADYIGAHRPIVGLVPPGASQDALNTLGGWHSVPSDISGISMALERALDHVSSDNFGTSWCNEEYRRSLCSQVIAEKYSRMIAGHA